MVVTLTEDQLKQAGITIQSRASNDQTALNDARAATRPGSGTIEDPYIDDLWFKDPENKVHKVQSSGGVKLNNTLTSTSTSEAATANTVKQLNDRLKALETTIQNLGITEYEGEVFPPEE